MASIFKIKKKQNKCSISKYKKINKEILIYRNCGGYGDILNMRMLFEDLKVKHPDFNFDWAVPYAYFPAASGHPFIRKIIHSASYEPENYLQVYDVTHACVKYEWLKGKHNDKNRADIWAHHIGIDLKNHNMWMPDTSKHFSKIIFELKNIGWDGCKKIVVFTPRSAMAVKNLTVEQCMHIQKITSDFFLVILHSNPILDLHHLKIPTICNLQLEEAMALIQFCNYVISTDTGHLHCAGGYKKPTLGIFCYTNGYEICKHYKTIHVLQKHWKDDPSYCGPCNNFATCTIAPKAKIKPCLTDISAEMIDIAWKNVLENNK